MMSPLILIGYAEEQLCVCVWGGGVVEVLRYKPVRRGFDSRWGP